MPRPRRIGAAGVVAAPPHLDGAVVRLDVGHGHWAEDIPPVPAGFTVTVSFPSEAVADEHRDALELLGYTVVGCVPSGAVQGCAVADVLIGEILMEQHPTYWRSLGEHALRVYALALGPAAAVVAPIVAAHARALRS